MFELLYCECLTSGVTLAVLLTFNRLKVSFQNTGLTNDYCIWQFASLCQLIQLLLPLLCVNQLMLLRQVCVCAVLFVTDGVALRAKLWWSQVSGDGLKIRRNPDLPCPTISLLTPEQRKELRDRTLYIVGPLPRHTLLTYSHSSAQKGFPEDSTLDDLQDFLEQYGQVCCLVLLCEGREHTIYWPIL